MMSATLQEVESFSRFAFDLQKSLDDVAHGRVKPVDQAFEVVRHRLGWAEIRSTEQETRSCHEFV